MFFALGTSHTSISCVVVGVTCRVLLSLPCVVSESVLYFVRVMKISDTFVIESASGNETKPMGIVGSAVFGTFGPVAPSGTCHGCACILQTGIGSFKRPGRSMPKQSCRRPMEVESRSAVARRQSQECFCLEPSEDVLLTSVCCPHGTLFACFEAKNAFLLSKGYYLNDGRGA